MASKKKQIADLERDLYSTIKSLESVQKAYRREIEEHEDTANDLTKAHLEIADVKAAWNHDTAKRHEAERDLNELRRQLSKIREAHEGLYNAIFPDLVAKGVFGGLLLDTDTFPQWQKMEPGAERC